MAIGTSSGASRRQLVPPEKGLKVSPYERVASFLLAGVLLVVTTTVALLAVWLGNRLPPRPAALPVLPIIVDDEDGGYPEGVEGSTMELPGEITPYLGTGLEELDEPPVEQSLDLITGVVAARELTLADPVMREKWATGIGGTHGGPGDAPPLGEGGGNRGGVPRTIRWRIQFDEGGSVDDYARQLDYFQIELGVLATPTEVQYGSTFTGALTRRAGAPDTEERLYFIWESGTRQEADRELLGRAGVDGAGKKVMQFYPAITENLLANVEDAYLKKNAPHRTIKGVRRTFFSVVPDGGGYTFVVSKQTYLDSRRHRGL